MPEIQELTVQAPSMMHDRFYVEKKGKDFKTWDMDLYDHTKLEFYYEAEQQWLPAVVDSWYIDDASGNAPGADAHFFLKVEREGKKHKIDLYEGMRVRLEVPTDKELKQNHWCQGSDWTGGYYEPEQQHFCSERGTHYKTPHGQSVFYCDKHKKDEEHYVTLTPVEVEA